jgi:hypothetical protein
MTYRFKISNYILAILPTVIGTCLTVWLFTITFSITFRDPIPENVSFIDLCLGTAFLLFPLLFVPILFPSYILAYQYWKTSHDIELKLGYEYIEIKNADSSEKTVFHKSEIQKIVSISPLIKHHRLFSSFSYLVLFSRGRQVVISCFLVTKDTFLQNFGPYDNLVESFPYTPFIKEKIYSRVEKTSKFNLTFEKDDVIQISGRYLTLLRSLLIPGLALLLFPAYRMGLIWFLTISILTLFIYFILLTQKKILITKTEIIVKYFGQTSTYPISSIKEIKELEFSRVTSISDPIIKIVILERDGLKKTYFFFPRDMAFPELKKVLYHDK